MRRRHKMNAKPLWACPVCATISGKEAAACAHKEKPVYFPSTGEYRRWRDLRLLERAGEISDLERQVRFDLDVNGVHIGRYTADFGYTRNGERVIEDFKGMDTDASKLRRKLVYAIHGVEVVIVRK